MPIPISSPGDQRTDVADDELRPLAGGDGAAERLGRGCDEATVGAGDDHGRGPLRGRGGDESRVKVTPADVVRRLCDRCHRLNGEGRAGSVFETGTQRRGQRRGPDDAQLDAVGIRPVIGADDAGREPNHEEEWNQHRAQSELHLGSLLVLRDGAGLCRVRHAASLFSSCGIGVAGLPLRDSSSRVRANTCCLVIVR